MDENILSGGVELLEALKGKIVELDDSRQRVFELNASEEAAEKKISSAEKAKSEEIAKTLKKRQAEIESSFSAQSEQINDRIKKTKAKREKDRNEMVAKRVSSETEGLRSDQKMLKEEIKELCRSKKVPGLYRNRYILALILPGGLLDYLAMLLTCVLIVGIPVGMYFLIPGELKTKLIAIAIFVVVVVLLIFGFAALLKGARGKHEESVREIKRLRTQIKASEKQEKKKGRAIRNDKDESQYDLSKYDEELADLDNQMHSLAEERKAALSRFDGQVSHDIREEIEARYNADITNYKAEYDQAHQEAAAVSERVTALSTELSNNYTAYIGRDMMNVPSVNALIEIISDGEAANVSEAIAVYKKRLEQAAENKQ